MFSLQVSLPVGDQHKSRAFGRQITGYTDGLEGEGQIRERLKLSEPDKY